MKYWIAGDTNTATRIANGVFDHLKTLNPTCSCSARRGEGGRNRLSPLHHQILAAKPDFVIVATGGGGMVNFRRRAIDGVQQEVPFYQTRDRALDA